MSWKFYRKILNVVLQNLIRTNHFEICLSIKILIFRKLIDEFNWNSVCFRFSESIICSVKIAKFWQSMWQFQITTLFSPVSFNNLIKGLWYVEKDYINRKHAHICPFLLPRTVNYSYFSLFITTVNPVRCARAFVGAGPRQRWHGYREKRAHILVMSACVQTMSNPLASLDLCVITLWWKL